MTDTTLYPNSPLTASVISDYNDLKEKLEATEEELEKAKNEAKEWEDKYTKLVHQNNLNEATIRSFRERCRYTIDYFDNIVGGSILNYNESLVNADFELIDLSNDNMETGRSIIISRKTSQIGKFFYSIWISKKLIAKRTIKRLRKMYKKFIFNGG